jgi:hypothetical protein
VGGAQLIGAASKTAVRAKAEKYRVIHKTLFSSLISRISSGTNQIYELEIDRIIEAA